MPEVKLGCVPSPPEKTRRALRFLRYVNPATMLPLPPSTRWRAKCLPPWGMFLNDQIGNCTCASLAHALQVWTANHGREVTVTDRDVVGMYTRVSTPPYDPRTGANDKGATMINVLSVYRRYGFAGRRLGAYAAVTPTDKREIQEAIFLTGGVYLGVDLPLSAQNQKDWTIPQNIPIWQRHQWRPGTWGGHAIYAVDYGANGVIAVTWGAEKLISYEWLAKYCFEAYALIAPEWVNTKAKAPNGLELRELLRDVQIATGEKIK